MTEKTKKSKKSKKTAKSALDRAADLSDEMLESVEAGQRAAIKAVRQFVDRVDEAVPGLGDRPSRRETVIDAALDMADKLVTTQYEFLRNAVRSADRTLSPPDVAPSAEGTQSRRSTTGKFEVYQDKAGKHRFRLKASNGQIIAVGEAYESKSACLNGIESVKKNAPDAGVVEVED